MKRAQILMALLLTFILGNVQPVHAETAIQDGIQVDINVDQEAYEEGAEVIVKASITNTNDFEVTNVNVSTMIPDGFYAKETQAVSFETLEVGETKNVEVVLVKKAEKPSSTPTQDNDNSDKTDNNHSNNSSNNNSSQNQTNASNNNAKNTAVSTNLTIIPEQPVAQTQIMVPAVQMPIVEQKVVEAKSQGTVINSVNAEDKEETETETATTESSETMETVEMVTEEVMEEETTVAEETIPETMELVEIEETAVAEAQMTSENKSTWIWIIIVLLILTVGVIVVVYKNVKKSVSMILVIVMAGSLVFTEGTINVQAASDTKTIQVMQGFQYAGALYKTGFQVSYTMEEDNQVVTLSSNVTEFSINQKGTTLYFYATANYDVTTMELYEQNGLQKVIELVDDGKYSSSGDDIPNDGVYSAKIVVNPQESTDYQYYVKAVNEEGVCQSNVVKISAYTSLMNADIADMDMVDKQLLSVLQSPEFSTYTLGEKQDKVYKLLLTLADTANSSGTGNLIIKDTIHYDEITTMYSFSYGCDVYGGVMLEDFSDEFCGHVSEASEQLTDKLEEVTIEEQTIEEVTEGLTEEQSTEEVTEELTKEQTTEEVTEEQITAEVTEEQITEEVTSEESVNDNVDFVRSETDENFMMLAEYPVAPMSLFSAKASTDYSNAKFSIVFGDSKKDGFESVYNAWTTNAQTLKNKGLSVTIEDQVTVADYMTILSGNDMVYIYSHGSRINYYTGFLWLNKHTESAICLNDEVSKAEDKTYKDDLKKHRLYKATTDDGTFYWLLPSFFSHYYAGDALDETIVLIASCNSFGKKTGIDDTMANAFLSSGAATVYGYYNSVYVSYDYNNVTSIVWDLADGESIGKAFDNALVKNGANDGVWASVNGIDPKGKEPAEPQLRGNYDKCLITTELQNGDFEESLTIANSKWNYLGDARIITKLADLKPQSGSLMSIITTGLGSGEDSYLMGTEGSSIYQTFTVPEGTTSLSFDYNVVSEEPMEYVGSSFDDKFVAQLLNSNGEVICELAYESVNTSTWHKIDGINFEGGDHSTYETTWKQVNDTTIANYVGQDVTIRFAVWDMQDSIYDTAALIDHVRLN